jgi:hypothetical protein
MDEDIAKSRQAWFWRRTTLQVTLGVILLMLTYTVCVNAPLEVDWTDVAIIAILTSAAVFLVSMYFAMVDNATKLAATVTAIGDAVDKARA